MAKLDINTCCTNIVQNYVRKIEKRKVVAINLYYFSSFIFLVRWTKVIHKNQNIGIGQGITT